MDDFEDPMDLLDDDGDGVIETCLLDEEGRKKGGGNGNAGCCLIFCILSASILSCVMGVVKTICVTAGSHIGLLVVALNFFYA